MPFVSSTSSGGQKKKRPAAIPTPASIAETVNALVVTVSKQMSPGGPSDALWSELDEAARHYVVLCLAFYTRLLPEISAWSDRKRRFLPVLNAVTRHIRVLRSTSRKRQAFQNLKDPKLGKISDIPPLSLPREVEFSLVIDHEVERLEELARKLRLLCNTKRLGIAGLLYHLILAQEYVSSWGRSVGTNLSLRPGAIAELIWIIDAAAGRKKINFGLPDNLTKALTSFQNNDSNAQLLRLLSAYIADLVDSKAT